MIYSSHRKGSMPEIPVYLHKPAIAAILPAYNEESSIATVLEVMCATDILDEIIVVDDGSRDKTVEVACRVAQHEPRLRIIQHGENQGKGQAIFTAWAATTASNLLLLDADLRALSPEHLRGLLAPILDHRADMTLGLFRGGRIATDISHWITPYLTGQRALRAEILKYVSPEAASGYGFEVALTIAANQQNYRTRIVPLKGVWHIPSEYRSERGFWGGARWKLQMYGQILRAWFVATRRRYPTARSFPKTIDH